MFNKQRLILSLAILLVAKTLLSEATPLDDYVNAPDSNYKWILLKTYEMTGYKVHILNLTSQKWLDETVTNKPIWWHYLCITVPDNITRPDAGFLLIDGGSNTDSMPQPLDNFVLLTSVFAISTGTIGADLQQVPNQPTVFLKDPTLKKRYEDAVIAWTWKTFLENPNDPSILLRLPMTKAAVKAMDAMTEFSETVGAKLSKFMIAGASKRGWTTWTTAAVDKRVFAAVPIVMDFLNMNTNLHNHYQSLGGWTFAFNDYYELNITDYVDSFSMFAMQKVIDPATYLDRYKNIKFTVVTTGGDEFFLADDTHFFWNDLKAATGGTAMLRRLPNAEHSCAGHEISLTLTLRSFFISVYDKSPLPQLSWSRPNNLTHGIIEAVVDIINGPTPSDVQIFYAKTLDDKRRDFRLLVGDPSNPSKPIPHPVVWLKDTEALITIETTTKITYRAAFVKPISGYFGFFIQFSFPGLENSVIEITTETNVIPETYPFPDCTLNSCRGKLV